MTPKETAKELFDKYLDSTNLYPSGAKQCALIAVDEIIDNMPYGFYSGIRPNYKGSDLNYWQEVRKEIEAL